MDSIYLGGRSMKSAKLFRKGIALLLCSTFLFGDVAVLNANEVQFMDVAPTEGSVTYFKANLFDYDQAKVNKATLEKVASSMTAEDKQKFVDYSNDTSRGDFVRENYPAILFSNNLSNDSTGVKIGDKTVQSFWGTRTENINLQAKNYYVNASKADDSKAKFGKYNKWFNGTQRVYQGIASDKLGSDGMIDFNYEVADLFTVEADTDYKTSYANVDIPFVYKNGYFIFDSDEYDYKMNEDNSQLTAEEGGNGFWPFGSSNYYYGMNMSVEFSMNEYGTVDGLENGDPAVFEFSGDDDIWVYIDDQLVLDMGGIHSAVSGSIDFANRKATITEEAYSETLENPSREVVLPDTLFDNDTHTLRVFYLERGAGSSNCKITFNMPTISGDEDITGDVSFMKNNGITQDIIEGAGFTLYADESCTEVVREEVISDGSGVMFADVPTGVYYMKETKTPGGFLDTGALYKVIVSGNSSESVIYYIKDENGANVPKNDNNEYVIYNQPDETQEFTVNKSDSVVDYDERIYQVDLEAKAPINYTQTEKNANVVLVLDVSGSMCNHKAAIIDVDTKEEAYQELMEFNVSEGTKYFYMGPDETGKIIEKKVIFENGQWYKWVDRVQVAIESSQDMPATYFEAERDEVLIRSAKEFVRILEKDSPESYVSVITFANTEEQAKNNPEKYQGGEATVQCDLLKVEGNIATIESAIEKAQANTNWCTYPSYGLNLAVEQFENCDNDNANYTVFFTDGDPTGALVTKVDEEEKQKSIDVATTLKTDYNSIVYAVGIDVTDTTYLQDVATKDCCIQLDDMSDLATNLRSISHSIVDTISNANIYDYIDDRFEVIVKNENEMYVKANVGDEVSVREDQVGTLQLDENKGYYVVWENQVIGSGSATSPKWTDSILLRAKEDFLGGNAVTTNKPDSGVVVDNNVTPFPMPTVNVKALEDEIEKEITYFLGDTIEVSNLIQELSDELSVANLGLSEMDLNSLLANKTVSVEYSYEDGADKDVLGELVYTITPSGETSQLTSHEATKTGKLVETYTLSVEYKPYSSEDRISNSQIENLVAPESNDGEEVTSATFTGVYNVNVIEGTLTITKGFDQDFISNLPYSQKEKDLIEANQTAVFTVSRYKNADDASKNRNALESFEVTITNGDGEVIIKHLKSGFYKVTENTDWSWKYELNKIDDTYLETTDGVVYFGIDGNTYDKQTVSFENKLDDFSMWFADTTNVVNVFK